MKKLFILCIITTLLFSFSGFKVNNTPDSFSVKFLKCLENKDEKAFKELLMNEEDLDYLIKKTKYKSEKDKQKVVSTKKERLKIFQEQYLSVLRKANYHGLHLIKCEYKVEIEDGFKFISGFSICATTSKNKVILVEFGMLIKFGNVWKPIGELKIGPLKYRKTH